MATENDAINQFVTALIREKGIDKTVDETVLAEIVSTMSDQLEEYINRALLEALNDDQIKAFGEIVNGENSVDEINNFFYNNNINTQEITVRSFQRFRDAYLGANTSQE